MLIESKILQFVIVLMDITDLKITPVLFVTMFVQHVQMMPLNVLLVPVSELVNQNVTAQLDTMKMKTEFVQIVTQTVTLVKVMLTLVPNVQKEETELFQIVLVPMVLMNLLPVLVKLVASDVLLVELVQMTVHLVYLKQEQELILVLVLMDTMNLPMKLNVLYVTPNTVLLVNLAVNIVMNVQLKELLEPNHTVHVPMVNMLMLIKIVKFVNIIVKHVPIVLIIVYLVQI